MHIEKNVCDNLVGTLLNIEGKTKDTLNAWLNLKDLKIRKDLHLMEVGNRLVKPHASYTITSSERVEFYKFLKSIKFFDGFVSNISRCVNERQENIKSENARLSYFTTLTSIYWFEHIYRKMCTPLLLNCVVFLWLIARTIRVSDLDRLQANIIIILCKLERIFPPAFFSVIIHLVVHLPYETKVAGSVTYSWMYSIERSLRTLK